MVNVVSDPHCFSGDNSSVNRELIVLSYEDVSLLILFQMAEALKALDKMDVDKDGKVSYPEFLLALKFN